MDQPISAHHHSMNISTKESVNMAPPPVTDAATSTFPSTASDAATYYGYQEGVEGSSIVHTGDTPSVELPFGATVSNSSSNILSSHAMTATTTSTTTFFMTGSSSSGSSFGGGGGGVPGSPLPADRLARKQRNFPRRGGFCHSALLKSAVMACMSEGDATNRNNNGGSSITASPDISAGGGGDLTAADLLQLQIPSNSLSSSPRKRMRRSDGATVIHPSGTPHGGASAGGGGGSELSTTTSTGSLCTTPTKPTTTAATTTANMMMTTSSSRTSPAPLVDDDAVIARATDLLQRLCVKPLDHSDGSSRHSRRTMSGSRHGGSSSTSIHNMMLMSGTGSNSTGSPSNHTTNNNGRDADFDRKAPVRRVSRRTSYTSQISTGTDYDDLDDDEFH